MGGTPGQGIDPFGPTERHRPPPPTQDLRGGQMALSVSVQNGTNAGVRKPFSQGHAPRCECLKCLPFMGGMVIYVPPKKEK